MVWLLRFLLAALALAAFLLSALAVNQQAISLSFLTWQTPVVSVFWWLMCAFVGGLLFGLLGIVVVGARQRSSSRLLTKRLAESEIELQRLRNLTLHE